MVATFVGAANAPTSGDSQATSRAVTKPAGAQVAVFSIHMWIGDGDGSGTITPANAAAGATLRNDTVVGAARTATFVKYVDGDATGATYTFNFTPNDPWSALKAIFFADVDAGLDLATIPFNTANTGGTGYATTTVTTVDGAALAWNGNAAEYSSAPTHTPPTNFTEVGDTDMSASAYRISPGDGSQSASGASTSGAVSNKISTLVALAPAATGAPSGTFAVADAATVGFVGARDSAAAFAIDDVATVEWTGTRDSTATFQVDDTATVEWTGSAAATASFAVADEVTVAWTGVGEQGVLAAIIVGAVTGPSRHVETVTGPALRREVTGPSVRRELTGPQLVTMDVDGPSRHVNDLDGPDLSRVVTGPDAARTLTGPGA